MAASKNYSSSLRKTFGLVAETPAPPIELAAPPTTVRLPQAVERAAPPPPLEETINPPVEPGRVSRAGRPRSPVERVPKTLALQERTEESLEDLVGAVQRWRGRKKGTPKVNQGEIADFAIEYLRRRLFEGQASAEDFYQEQEIRQRAFVSK